MKLILERWNRYLAEQKEYALLNEGSKEDVVLWMEAKTKAGMSLADIEVLISEVVSEVSRRGFLKGLLRAVGVAAAGAPSKALAPGARDMVVDPPEKIIKYIRGLFERAKQSYNIGGIPGKKTIKDFADIMDTSEDVVKGIWPKIHQRFALALDNMLIKMMPLESDDTQAVVHSVKDDNGVFKPVAMVLNPKLNWSIGLAEPFPKFPKDTPATVLQHEAEHAIEKALIYASIGKLEPIRIAGESLDTVFDMSSTTGDNWADDPEEIYAEFRALRTRLGGRITKSDLDDLCKIQCNDPEASKIPLERQISVRMIPKLRCNGCSFDNSKRGVDGANYFAAVGDDIDAKINARGISRTMVAERTYKDNNS